MEAVGVKRGFLLRVKVVRVANVSRYLVGQRGRGVFSLPTLGLVIGSRDEVGLRILREFTYMGRVRERAFRVRLFLLRVEGG